MKNQYLAAVAVIVSLYLISFGSTGLSPRSLSAHTFQQETTLTNHAKGTFDVKVSPQSDDAVGDPSIGRLSLDKQFQGDLEGTSNNRIAPPGQLTLGRSFPRAMITSYCAIPTAEPISILQRNAKGHCKGPHLFARRRQFHFVSPDCKTAYHFAFKFP